MCRGNLRLKNDLDISLNISGYGQPGSRCYVEVCVVQDQLTPYRIRSDQLTPYRIRSDQCVIPRGENVTVHEINADMNGIRFCQPSNFKSFCRSEFNN